MRNGFNFSVSKTKVVHFMRTEKLLQPPVLKMCGEIVPYDNKIKFLGLSIDEKVTCRTHIAELKVKCTTLGLLRLIASDTWGESLKMIMLLYRALIRSKLDYAAIVYGAAVGGELEKLNAIANDAMKIALGAFIRVLQW